jgi:hypothetical protein
MNEVSKAMDETTRDWPCGWLVWRQGIVTEFFGLFATQEAAEIELKESLEEGWQITPLLLLGQEWTNVLSQVEAMRLASVANEPGRVANDHAAEGSPGNP